jgi:hypothetical protein
MPGVNLQFHMLFDEVVDFVAKVRSQYALTIELERYFPSTFCVVLPDADLKEQIDRFGHVDRIWLLCKPPRSRKFERFALNVCKMRDKRLPQGQFGGATEKADAYKTPKKVAQELKRRTTAGIWVITEAGNIGYSKNSRISPGAAKAARAGTIELVSIAFTQSYRVDRPDDLGRERRTQLD